MQNAGWFWRCFWGVLPRLHGRRRRGGWRDESRTRPQAAPAISKTVVRLGDVERRDERFEGLTAGNHTLHFEFDTPKSRITPVVVTVDSLRTAGNRLPNAAQLKAEVKLD